MNDTPFSMQDIPGKGKGLIATRPIAQGELILAEKPLFFQSLRHSNATVLAALTSLSDADQRRYFSLANAWKGIHPPPIGIFITNALPCGENDAGKGVNAPKAGIFLDGSRFNSSCQPNVNNYWNEDLQKITFWATSDIASGEELCMCYGDTFKTREDRRRQLQSSFRFVCQCVACSKEGEALRASDERRAAIARLYDEIEASGNIPSLGVREVKMALRLLAEENLLERSVSFCIDAIQFCVSVSDIKNAKAWAKKALEVSILTTGPNSKEVKTMTALMEDVRQHRSFGLLPRAKLSGPET
ncbi:SET domain-containing protein [Dichomitus squalens]|uniref:SET domain-containing protein n=1 Tax=Dichomitus squalens TaxID=114155 RepID=A0A4Q9PZU8_9APHY|nr:SET domain-containing protein [Dichomitus squalens]